MNITILYIKVFQSYFSILILEKNDFFMLIYNIKETNKL